MLLNVWAHYLLLTFFVAPVVSTGGSPYFVSKGNKYKAVAGDTQILPCVMHNLGSLVSLWRRGNNVLTASSLIVIRDDRFRLVEGYNLQIRMIQPQDAGDYICQISDHVTQNLVHTLEVLVPPNIKLSPNRKIIILKQGEEINIECLTAGNPTPKIKWFRLPENDTVDPTTKSNSEIILEIEGSVNVTKPNITRAYIGKGPLFPIRQLFRTQSGEYECTADNGVTVSASRVFSLRIQYPPEILLETNRVHSEIGHAALLKCSIESVPLTQECTTPHSCASSIPEMVWYKDDYKLIGSSRWTMASKIYDHTIFMRKLEAADFGNYSCVANNSLGRSSTTIELTQLAVVTNVTTVANYTSRNYYKLQFFIDSYSKIEELRIFYRRQTNISIFDHTPWHDELVPAPKLNTSVHHTLTYNIKGLLPNVFYETMIQARNKHGWNRIAWDSVLQLRDIFIFKTFRPEVYDLADQDKAEQSSSDSATAQQQLTAAAIICAMYMFFF